MPRLCRARFLLYTSRHNAPLAYNWKIKFNESAKIPAFYNVFPELNHNEMDGFDVVPSTENLAQAFHIIILKDDNDNPRILKRMEVLQRLYGDRGLAVSVVQLTGSSVWGRAFNSLILAEWAAYYVSQYYGTEPEQVPMVEEFKKMIA